MIKQNQTYLNRLHVVMDAVCIYFAGFAAWYIRFKCTIFGFWLNQEIFDLNRYYPEFYQYQKPLISSLILLLLLYSFFGLYTPKRYQRGSKELVNLVKANLIGLGLSAFVITVWQIQNFPRSLYLLFYLFNFIFGLLSRYIIRRILKTNRKKGRNIKHTVFIGFSTSAAAYIDRIKSNPQWGLKVHGIFDDLVSDNFEYRGIKKIGTLSDLAAYLEKTSLDEVAITLNLNEYHKLEQIVAICEKSGVHTKFVPDYYNFISTNPYTEDLDGLPVINIRNVPLTNTMNKLIKRLIDIIGSIIAIRYIFRVNMAKEEENLKIQSGDAHHKPHMMSLEVRNESISGKTLIEIKEFLGRNFVCSRIRHEGHVSIPDHETIFNMGDQLFIVCSEEDAPAITVFIGKEVELDWEKQDLPMVSRRILVTKPEINGKTLGSMHFRSMYGVNVTRINRSGMDLFADPNLILQVGDRVMVVGQQDAVERVAGVLGNQLKRLDTPNIVTIFVGIFLGILLGSLPIAFPGMPTPLKLGLAGGPLVVAILIGRFGHKLHLVTYTTMSANLMLREIGIVLFLASVGIDAGANFVQTVVEGDGLLYVGSGFLITVIPLLIIGTIARLYYKVNYFTLMGLIAGSNTDPPALAYANQTTSGDAPAVGYSTVYPLSMFLRILTGQMILLAMM